MMRALTFALACAALPAALSAQTLFATRGLGVPVEAVDARARILGGTGVGLLGVNPSLVNPAELGGARRGVAAVLQPATHNVSVGDEEEQVGSTRFPLLSVFYPLTERLMLSFGYGAFLEQSWGVREEGTTTISGEEVDIEDVIRVTGGISQLRLSAAYAIRPNLSVGLSGGILTGNHDRSLTRTFDDSASTLRPFASRLRWEYSGGVGAVGAQWRPVPALQLGASLMMTSHLKADAVSGPATDRLYGKAMTVAAGASGLLTPDLLVAVSGARHTYPEVTSAQALSRDTWAMGGGVEYGGLRAGRRSFPVRLGARWQQLPYYAPGEDGATEVALGFGLGFNMASDAVGPLAVVDTGVERVQRTGLGAAGADELEESMWRWTVSLSLFGR